MGAGAAELLARKGLQAGAPVTVVFQVTDRCNYGCVHCYETHGDAEELSLAQIDRVFGEIAAEGTLFLTLTGGEFFMRRDAEDILRAARRHRFAVKLLTTGWFVDEARADLIADLGSIQVDMSFYSGDPKVHDHVTQMIGSWRRTVEAAKRLRARDVIVTLKSPVMEMNVEGMVELAQAARDLGCDHMFDTKVTGREDGDRGPLGCRTSDAALRAFYASDLLGNLELMQKILPSQAPSLDETPCRAGRDVCGINPQGMVSACHSIRLYGGDLRTQNFHDIWWGGEEIRRVRELTWRNIDECNRCDVRAYCTRCHSMAHLEDGRIDGPSTEACRHAVLLRDLLRERGSVPADHVALPPPLEGKRLRLRVLG